MVVAQEIGKIHISGDVISPQWFQEVKKENGKPHLLAIMLLANIVYWYQPVRGRDERTGRPLEIKTRFKGQYLQRTYSEYGAQFSVSREQVKAAIDTLVRLNLVQRKYVSGDNDGMYIIPNPRRIMEITHGSGEDVLELEFVQEEPVDKKPKINREEPKQIIEYLNEARKQLYPGKRLRGFEVDGSNIRLIRARLREGYGVEDFKTVIDFKVRDWKGTRQIQYVRPSTLFAAKHFNEYLAAASEFEDRTRSEVEQAVDSLMG